MKILAHINLHKHTDCESVYESYQRDYNRCTITEQVWQLAFLSCGIAAAWIDGTFLWAWVFGGLHAFYQAGRAAADNIGRNWAMHVIDWIEMRKVVDDR